MKNLITVDETKCVGCNACVRTCPAPEANITKMLENGRFVTTVNGDKCIACGECVRNCTHGARNYVDDTEEAMDILQQERMIIIAAPAIKSVFPDKWKSILNWFKSKGCLVYDVSFGADICTWAHLRLIQYDRVGNIVTQPCAAIVKYAETYQPGLLRNLSKVHSPMLCGVTYIRNVLGRTEKIAALSPCIAKKNEFEETGLVNYNITFKKMMEYFDKHGVKLPAHSAEDMNYEFDGGQGQVGGIYPRPGGLRDNLWLHDPELNITTSEGVHKVYPELDMYAALAETKKPRIFDVLSCEYGCNVGAGTGTTKTIYDIMESMREVEKNAKGKRKTGWLRGSEDKLFKKFDDILRLEDYLREYKENKPSKPPTAEELDAVFESMGKHTMEERNYNCHACGYRSCRDMATAIHRGLNVPDNCIVHAKAAIMEVHKELEESHKTLEAQNEALTQRHEQISEATMDCKKLTEQLSNELSVITGDAANIDKMSEQTGALSNTVKKFIDKLIFICGKKDSMNKEELEGLAKLLEQTNVAFTSLNSSIKQTESSAASVKERTDEITELVGAINETLEGCVEEMENSAIPDIGQSAYLL